MVKTESFKIKKERKKTYSQAFYTEDRWLIG